jgi:hypothetical protein
MSNDVLVSGTPDVTTISVRLPVTASAPKGSPRKPN